MSTPRRSLALTALALLTLTTACSPPTSVVVTIHGKTFTLEPALDAEKRFRGLSNRTDLPADGGMLFVFPESQVKVQGFVMRDCPAPIDIIYLDRDEKVTGWHTMQPEAPRTPEEKSLVPPYQGAPMWSVTNDKYEKRLKQYTSYNPAKFAIELRGGATQGMPLKVGDHIDVPDNVLGWVQ